MKIMCVCVTEREGPASEGWRQGKDLNWNAGHRAARRFRFCLRSPLQVGNPPDTKCILIKIQDTPTSPAEIEARRLNGDRQNTWPTWQAILTDRASGAVSGRFVQAQRERSDEGAGVIGLMFECMAIRFLFKSSDSLIRPGSGSLIIFQRRLIKDGGTAGMKMNESQARWGHFQFSFQKLRCVSLSSLTFCSLPFWRWDRGVYDFQDMEHAIMEGDWIHFFRSTSFSSPVSPAKQTKRPLKRHFHSKC